ncbi:class I SAM-dependent methyltransferase, partial [Candidatus Pacearchaeota archaeon]|nr:class I SAM-dependent methyltransferase [Candidatus Pacearchaeota archaeon]
EKLLMEESPNTLGLSDAVANKIKQFIEELLKQKRSKDKEEILKTRAQMDILLSEVASLTRRVYNRFADDFTARRGDFPKGNRLEVLEKLMENIRQQGEPVRGDRYRVLDEGTGLRDLRWLDQQTDVLAVGIDFSDQLISSIRKSSLLSKRVELSVMDMYSLDFANKSFDGVRAQSSILHIPLVDKEQGVDVVVREANRVLKIGGTYYVNVKAETDNWKGFMPVDTGEGFGERLYQFYDEKTIRGLVERNGFQVKTIEISVNFKGEKEVKIFAQKIKDVSSVGDIDLNPNNRNSQSEIQTVIPDFDLARQGISDLKSLISSLPEKLADVVKTDKYILQVFSGLTPEYRSTYRSSIFRKHIPFDEMKILVDEINKIDNFAVIFSQDVPISIINKEAVKRILQENPEQFKDANADVEWIINNPQLWMTSLYEDYSDESNHILYIRHGLMSGFPKNAALHYPKFQRIQQEHG